MVFTLRYLATQDSLLHFLQLLLPLSTILGLHITGDLHDFEDPDNNYWSGAMWAIVTGLMGAAALVVFIFTFFAPLSKSVLKWYYFCAALIVLSIASIGLGMNPSVDAYHDCKAGEKNGTEIMSVSNGLWKRCDYGDLVKRFMIYILSVFHSVVYGISFCIAASDKPAKPRVGYSDSSTTTTLTTVATYGDSVDPSL